MGIKYDLMRPLFIMLVAACCPALLFAQTSTVYSINYNIPPQPSLFVVNVTGNSSTACPGYPTQTYSNDGIEYDSGSPPLSSIPAGVNQGALLTVTNGKSGIQGGSSWTFHQGSGTPGSDPYYVLNEVFTYSVGGSVITSSDNLTYAGTTSGITETRETDKAWTYDITTGVQVFTYSDDDAKSGTTIPPLTPPGCVINYTRNAGPQTATLQWSILGAPVNTSSAKINITPPALVAPSVGLPGINGMPISQFACGVLPSSNPFPTIPIDAELIDATGNTIAGGDLVLSLSEVEYSGGHPHTGRPLGMLSSNSGPSPLNATYTPGEASGVINLTVTGTAPDGSTPEPVNVAIAIATSGFVDLSDTGVTFNIVSHPQGTYGTVNMHQAVMLAANEYAKTFPPPLSLNSQAASLIYGGIFDYQYAQGKAWIPPHCSHRDGRTLDVSFQLLTPEQQVATKAAFRKAGFGTPITEGTNGSSSGPHWHYHR